MGSTFNFLAVAALAAVLAVPSQAQQTAPPPAEPPAAEPPAAGAPAAAEPQPQFQAQPQDGENRRFVFHRIGGNLLRLDMRTGAVDTCGPTGAEWTCAPGHDERGALDREIARLQRDNATLKNALLEHGVALPDGMVPPPPGARNWWNSEETIPRPPQTVPPAATPGSPAPGNPAQGGAAGSEFDRVVDAVESGWRRLVEVMTNLRRDLQR
jgi:hypothetical protein